MTTHYRVDEERLETDGSSVTISNVGLDDEGTYKCILDFKTDPSINEEFTTVVVRIKDSVYSNVREIFKHVHKNDCPQKVKNVHEKP